MIADQTTHDIAAVARHGIDRIVDLEQENKRLTANAQAEHFEREWYLRGDEIVRLQRLSADTPRSEMRLRLFHGTPISGANNLKPSASGLFGSGIYLSTSDVDASQYGNHIAEVSIKVQRPFHTTADYSVAEAYDCVTPAGPMMIEVLGTDKAAALMSKLRSTEDGCLNNDWTQKLRSMGHDSICVSWPDGTCHWVIFDPENICSIYWQPANDTHPSDAYPSDGEPSPETMY